MVYDNESRAKETRRRFVGSGLARRLSQPMKRRTWLYTRGWNRVVLQVLDLPACIASLEQAGVPFRNEMEVGPGGRQIQIEAPDGNSLELFEPARRS